MLYKRNGIEFLEIDTERICDKLSKGDEIGISIYDLNCNRENFMLKMKGDIGEKKLNVRQVLGDYEEDFDMYYGISEHELDEVLFEMRMAFDTYIIKNLGRTSAEIDFLGEIYEYIYIYEESK